jgi:hypothetical protein
VPNCFAGKETANENYVTLATEERRAFKGKCK